MVMSLDQLSGVKTVKSELDKNHNLYFLNNRRKNKMRHNSPLKRKNSIMRELRTIKGLIKGG